MEPVTNDASNRQNIQDEAREYYARLLSGDATSAEVEEIRKWALASEDRAAELARLDELWEALALVDNVEVTQPARRAVSSPGSTTRRLNPSVHRKQASRRFFNPMFGIAAGLMIVFTFAVQFIDRGDVTVEIQRFETAIGEVRDFTLPDGSTATLGAASAINIAFDDGRRDVSLESGRAYFDVMPDADAPFTVSTGEATVRALGTAFSVWRGPNDIRVAVDEGAVALAQADAVQTEAITLEAGDGAVANFEGVIKEHFPVNQEDIFAWRNGRLAYVDMRLSDIIFDLNRYRDVKIISLDQQISAIRITASFDADKSDGFLTGIALSELVRIEPGEQEIFITPLN